MSVQLLKKPEVFPSAKELGKALNEKYPILEEFLGTAESEDFNLMPAWRYYKDGHAWLCKITLKKKTVFWVSVWSDCFKEFYANHKPIGKLKPLVIEVKELAQLADISTLIRYKINQF